jgi:Contractile injection system tube protein
MTLVKAVLRPAPEEDVDNRKEFEIKFMFNPAQIVFQRKANWTPAGSAEGKELLPKTNFSKVDPYTLTLNNIIFDSYETRQSVEVHIKKLRNAVLPKKMDDPPKDRRPAVYHFVWGKPFVFRCVVTSLKVTYEMFLPDGTPVRAKVNLTLKEVDKVSVTDTSAQPKRTKDSRPSRKR